MKKNFFYFAMALCVALCNVACGDDNEGGDDGGYTTPKYSEQAAAYTISEGVENQVKADATGGEEVILKSLNFTEDGKVVVGVEVDGALKYVTYDVVISGDTYTVKSGTKVLGTITKVTTRGGNLTNLRIDFSISLPAYGTVHFATEAPVQAVKLVKAVIGGDIIGTWKVNRMKLTIDFDDKAKTDPSLEVKSGNLTEFVKLAEDNGVNLTEEEENRLSREIISFTVDQYSMFSIAYKDGGSDAASWKWDGSGKSKLKITLKNSDMGNKFLEDNSTIEVKYPGNNLLVLKMTTRLEDDKCKATLTVNLGK